MEWNDFLKVFTKISFCNRSTGLRDLNLDVREDDGCVGVCKGCMSGCCEYWCCCKGCKALYCDHKASYATMKLDGKGRDDDILDVLSATMARD